MLVNRLIKPNTDLYKDLSHKSIQFDYLMAWDPLRWFGMWCMVLSGFNIAKGIENRYIFWDWKSGTMSIFFILIIVTIWTVFSSKNPKIPKNIDSLKSVLYFFLLGLSCLILGSFSHSMNIYFINYAPYLLYYFCLLFVFSIDVKSDGDNSPSIIDGNQRLVYLFIACILSLISSLLGYLLDDPIISTISTVYTPFLIVSIVMPMHIRHIQRARIYGLFIPAVFLSIRYPWFLIPLWSLFFILRVYHYFRFNTVFPTFAVDIE
ncbi:MAG: hypothetical protein VX578_03590 [Candidatus Neomarinimicrobiota bacterium]|jgi:Ca2+/Na+ antiporter|nr:hypothetical protein [Candidatus Neomarinimicrobiota bacterium]|tara:strand:+ start:1026 stop:1814 length:789 start_codon:yes stop_codon:yes gene_type:complete